MLIIVIRFMRMFIHYFVSLGLGIQWKGIGTVWFNIPLVTF